MGSAILDFKKLERSVTVKGLAEREVNADIVIWPIQFSVAENDLQILYEKVDEKSRTIHDFLMTEGLSAKEISVAPTIIKDKSAESYGGSGPVEFRYTASQTVTVYSHNIASVRKVMGNLSRIDKKGIALTGQEYVT